MRWLIGGADDPYSLEQLKSPRMNAAVVRPLLDHLYDPDDVSMGEFASHCRLPYSAINGTCANSARKSIVCS